MIDVVLREHSLLFSQTTYPITQRSHTPGFRSPLDYIQYIHHMHTHPVLRLVSLVNITKRFPVWSCRVLDPLFVYCLFTVSLMLPVAHVLTLPAWLILKKSDLDLPLCCHPSHYFFCACILCSTVNGISGV